MLLPNNKKRLQAENFLPRTLIVVVPSLVTPFIGHQPFTIFALNKSIKSSPWVSIIAKLTFFASFFGRGNLLNSSSKLPDKKVIVQSKPRSLLTSLLLNGFQVNDSAIQTLVCSLQWYKFFNFIDCYLKVTKLWQKIKNHFLEIVHCTCNTTFLYQNLMGNPKKQKKPRKFTSILAATHVFLWSYIILISEHKYLWKIGNFFKKFKLCLVSSIKYLNVYEISLPPGSKFTPFPIYSEDKIWILYERK